MSDTTDNLTVSPHPCNFCGDPTYSFHSGSWECGRCWDWRKLDGPAARYWTKAIERLFEDPETGSRGPDAQDWRNWHRWGMADSVNQALHTLSAIAMAYEATIEAEAERRQRSRDGNAKP